jgi:hypothetical protein
MTIPAIAVGVALAGQVVQPPPAISGTIRGLVTDPLGRPIEGASLSALSMIDGRPSGLRGRVTTDAGGRYVLRVLAGEYAIQVMGPRESVSPSDLLTERPRLLFYPGVESFSQAGVVRVVAGRIVSGIDTALPVEERFAMSGHFIRSQSVPDGRVDAWLTTSPARSVRQVAVGDDGAFEISVKEPGRYALWARAPTRDGFEVAWQIFNVSSHFVGLQLPLVTAGRVTGRIVAEDDAPLPVQGMRVAAVLMDANEDIDPLARDQVETDADGSFEIDGLFGDRRLRVIGLPDGWTVARVLSGRNAIITTLVVGPGEHIAGARIVIAPR